MTLVAWQADKRGVRSWAALSCFVLSGIGFVVQGALPSHAFKARYAALCVTVPFIFATNPPQLSWLTANIADTGVMTLALPLNQSIGQIGQLIGIYIYKPSEAPAYPTGHFTNAGFLLTGAAVTLLLCYIYTRRNGVLQSGERRWQL
ncbi:hypothetical protein PHLGIDRAFT_404972 [Phlebiopsis gigantea 11061_1 CR5-6]|uniref:Major facilitator superfamily (MFS) profile domain-containing protein n=1 Tax=Phlebiopsis gigantea (strain 11061_1 CR5-6) TaxID=745531 RepID=A0A0C3RZM3_PHLG1|nr:hypothetical protein PHLGIDRAFT_404972 [Phlebiopsis gigantea 11061_1 CR5-6]